MTFEFDLALIEFYVNWLEVREPVKSALSARTNGSFFNTLERWTEFKEEEIQIQIGRLEFKKIQI